MTIREYLRNRRRISLMAIALFTALLFLALWRGADAAPGELESWRRMFVLVALIGLAVILVLQFFLLRCPRCTRFLGPELRVSLARPINYCPYCGVHLEEKLEQ